MNTRRQICFFLSEIKSLTPRKKGLLWRSWPIWNNGSDLKRNLNLLYLSRLDYHRSCGFKKVVPTFDSVYCQNALVSPFQWNVFGVLSWCRLILCTLWHEILNFEFWRQPLLGVTPKRCIISNAGHFNLCRGLLSGSSGDHRREVQIHNRLYLLSILVISLFSNTCQIT